MPDVWYLVRCSNCGYHSDASYTGDVPEGWCPTCQWCGPQPHDPALDLPRKAEPCAS